MRYHILKTRYKIKNLIMIMMIKYVKICLNMFFTTVIMFS